MAHAAREAQVSYAWAKAWEKSLSNDAGTTIKAQSEQARLPSPIPLDDLRPDPRRGLDDFEFFRRHYLGHVSTPWQVETAYTVVEALETHTKEYIVESVAPGVGKTTLVHDIACWVTVKNRRIRGLFGSRIENNARRQLRRVRRSLERTSPPSAPSEQIADGVAVDAKGCLAKDYGFFRPLAADLWTAGEFIVAQFDDIPIDEKEPTWSSYGMNSGVLGNRFNVIFWDDVVDRSTIRTLDAQNDQREWWDTEGECVPGWAEIDMADGSRRRADELGPGDEVAGAANPTVVVATADNGVEMVYRLTTRAGRVAHLTGNHPVLTPAGWVRADASAGYGCRVAGAWPTSKMDADDAAILGYLVGDGGTTKGYALFTNADDAVLARMTSLCEARGWKVRPTDTKSLATNLNLSGGVRDFIKEHGIECRAELKRVPQAVMAGGPEAWRAFAGAYFDCDGTVSNRIGSPQVRYASTSHGLLRDVQALLSRLGLPSRIGSPNRKNGTFRPCWPLEINTSAAVRAFAEFPITDRLKSGRLAAHHAPPRFMDASTDWIETVEPLGEMATVAIETEDHTFCTGGIVTHNTRLEPKGVLFLVGQRMGSSDLYRYCLDKRMDAEGDEEDATGPPVYRHIVYRAHDETKCNPELTHARTAPAWPEGCLLDPYRLPWSGAGGLRSIRSTKPQTYLVSYQQEDVDPENVLVPEVWLAGGRDPETGSLFPGCYDKDRGLCELPEGLYGPKVSVASVDPSPTKMWAAQWWIHTPDAASQSWLMDLERKAMAANELLDWDANAGEFYGLMEDWQARSVRLGWPITTWIIEQNAAQRFLLAYDHVRRWMAKWGVNIIGHNTGPRKLDDDHGPWIMRDNFRFGRVRLPFSQRPGSRACIQTMKFTAELVRWPNAGVTDDTVMAAWFYFLHLPYLVRSASPKILRARRPPEWLGDKASALAAVVG